MSRYNVCDCHAIIKGNLLTYLLICTTDAFVFSSRGHLTAVEYMFKKYIEKLRTHDPACPLCHRPFDEQTEVEELISEARPPLAFISRLLIDS